MREAAVHTRTFETKSLSCFASLLLFKLPQCLRESLQGCE